MSNEAGRRLAQVGTNKYAESGVYSKRRASDEKRRDRAIVPRKLRYVPDPPPELTLKFRVMITREKLVYVVNFRGKFMAGSLYHIGGMWQGQRAGAVSDMFLTRDRAVNWVVGQWRAEVERLHLKANPASNPA